MTMTDGIDSFYSSQEFILEIILVFHTRSELEKEEEDTTQLDKLPRWTVRELEDKYEIVPGIELIKNLLAQRFSDPFKDYVKDEVAVELQTKPEDFPEEIFEGYPSSVTLRDLK
jgi:hypothetical protein